MFSDPFLLIKLLASKRQQINIRLLKCRVFLFLSFWVPLQCLILINSLCFPAVEMRKFIFVDKPQVKMMSFQNYEH